MKKSTFKFMYPIWFLLFFFSSCNDINLSNISNVIKIDESLVLPLGEGSISVQDILTKLNNQNSIVTNGDTINFQTELDREYKFGDINLVKNSQSIVTSVFLSPGASVTIPANSDLPKLSTNVRLNLGLDPNSTTQRVDSVKILSGIITVKINVTNLNIKPTDLNVSLVIPNSNNSIVTLNISPTQFNVPFDVTIPKFLMNTLGISDIPVTINLLAKTGNTPVNMDPTSKIDINLKIVQLNFEAAYGRFEPSLIGSSTIKIPLDILSSLPKGLRFANPKAFIRIESNIGTYLRFNIDEVIAYSMDYLTSTQALFNGSKSTVDNLVNKPLVPGQFALNTLRTLDKNYGTTDKLFDTTQKLDTLVYKFSLQTDIDHNNISTTPSYIIPSMIMKAHVKVQIPFYLKEGSNFIISDTIKNIGSLMSNIQQGTLVLKVTNALPVKVSLKMKFLDENNDTIKSTLNNSTYVINSGIVNTDINSASFGIVTQPTITPLNIELTKEQAEQLKITKSLEYTITAEGQDKNKAMQFTTKDYFKLKLGVFVKGSLTTTIGSTNN